MRANALETAIGPDEIIRKKTEYLIPCVYHFYNEPMQIVRGKGQYLYTSLYYKLLFAGELGYKLEAVITSYPRLFGFELFLWLGLGLAVLLLSMTLIYSLLTWFRRGPGSRYAGWWYQKAGPSHRPRFRQSHTAPSARASEASRSCRDRPARTPPARHRRRGW